MGLFDWLFKRKKKVKQEIGHEIVQKATVKPKTIDRRSELRKILNKKGMVGRPVICTCGEVYGEFWKYCIVCGVRKEELPNDSFPDGR